MIGNQPLIEMVPLYRDPKSGAVMTQWDMRCVEKVGLIKFDFLGLKTLTVIADAERRIRAGGFPDFSVEALPLDDEPTYDLMCRGDTEGVFQLESSGMTDLVMKLKPRAFKEVIPLVALYRPGPLGSGMVDDYVSRKHGLTKVEYLLPELEELTAETLGVIVYQDQVLQIANQLAGYSLGEADLLRRAMGKKKPEEMAKQREQLRRGRDGARHRPRRGRGDLRPDGRVRGLRLPEGALDRLRADHLPDRVPEGEPPARVPGGAALDRGRATTTSSRATSPTRARMKIEVLPPDVNESERDFTVVAEGIRFGLAGVKNVGEGAIEAIVEEREQGGRFVGLFELRRARRQQAREPARRREPRALRRLRLAAPEPRRGLGARSTPRSRRGAAAQRDREIGQSQPLRGPDRDARGGRRRSPTRRPGPSTSASPTRRRCSAST